MLLRDEGGNAILDAPEIQKALFIQMEKIFQDNNWPFAHNRFVVSNLVFNQEAVDLMDAEITEKEVRKALTGLRGGKSAGPTDLPPELLKNVPLEVINCLVEWSNNILDRGELPAQNETSNMIFLFRKGDPTKLDNYRTVSLHRRTPDILHTDIPIYTLPPLFVPINILPVILGHSRLCEHNNWQRLR